MSNTVNDIVVGSEKKYKDPTIATVGITIKDPNRLPTGLFSFDLATGGGVPMGRISIFYGTEDSMKTTLCMKLIASAQRLYPEKTAVFVDVEGVFGKSWAETMGVDTKKLVYVRPDNAEQVVDLVEGFLSAEDVSVVVLDSLAALVTQHELDKSAEDVIVGRTGLIVGKLYRKVTVALSRGKREGREPTLVVINQIRYKIGVRHGNPEVTPGGMAFKFGSSMTLRCYGKDIMDSNVSTTLPAYKEVSIIVKKYKVPVLAKNIVITIALQSIAQYGLTVGDAYDWKTLVSYLKSMELLVKSEKGWQLTHPGTGEVTDYETQLQLKKKIYNDVDYGAELKSALIKAMMDSEEVLG